MRIPMFTAQCSIELPIFVDFVCGFCNTENFDTRGILRAEGLSERASAFGTTLTQQKQAQEAMFKALDALPEQIRQRDFRNTSIHCKCSNCYRAPLWVDYSKYSIEKKKHSKKTAIGLLLLFIGVLFLSVKQYGLAVLLLLGGIALIVPMLLVIAKRIKMDMKIDSLPENQLPRIRIIQT